MKRSPIKPGSGFKPRTTPIATAGMLRVSAVQRVDRNEPKPVRVRLRKCKNRECKTPFAPDRPFVWHCSDECAVVIGMERVAKQKAAKEKAEQAEARQKAMQDRADTKAKLEQYKPLEYWLKKAESVCNEYIRARDPNVCISCGVTHSSAWQAGHYISVGANRTIRFHEDNIHKQCIHCNMHKASNATEYRIRLIEKIGVERVEWLESWHSPVKMTREAAQEIESHYKAKIKELKAGQP